MNQEIIVNNTHIFKIYNKRIRLTQLFVLILGIIPSLTLLLNNKITALFFCLLIIFSAIVVVGKMSLDIFKERLKSEISPFLILKIKKINKIPNLSLEEFILDSWKVTFFGFIEYKTKSKNNTTIKYFI